MLSIFTSPAYSQEVSNADTSNRLTIMLKQFQTHRNDLLELEDSIHKVDRDESLKCIVLIDIATEVQDYIDTIQRLMLIYPRIQKKEDRAFARLLINEKIKIYIGEIDLFIRNINSQMPSIKRPAIALSGTRLRDQLRELREILTSINLA
jgi:hypothetical protein